MPDGCVGGCVLDGLLGGSVLDCSTGCNCMDMKICGYICVVKNPYPQDVP